MEIPNERKSKNSTVIIVAVAVAMLTIGSLFGYWAGYTANSSKINDLQDQLSDIQQEINNLQTEIEPGVQNQTGILQEIDALQIQLSTIRSQIDSLQSSYGTNQSLSQINSEITSLQNQLSNLQQQINEIRNTATITYENVTYIFGETDLTQLFEKVRESVVVIQALVRQTDMFGRTYLATVQGSGFANNFTGQMTIITCNHVIGGATSINVTFSNGNTYTASVRGSNASTDVAVLTTNAPQNEYKPLLIGNSSSLKVGIPIIVIGTPYGLEGSMSTGIVSATNRTIIVEQTTMTNMIQTTAPLNPGNSGGPLMDYEGQVIGMADAIIQESQGIGLAVPSNTILQNIVEIMT